MAVAPEVASLLAVLSGAVLLLDGQGRLLAASPAAQWLLEVRPGPEGVGRMPDGMRRSSELLACLRERRPAELQLTTSPGSSPWRLKLTPLEVPAGMILMEIFDLSREAELRGEVLSLHHAHEDLQAAHEELLCAYEIIEANQQRDHAAQGIREHENQRLLQSNLELRRALDRARLSPRRPRKG